MGGLIEHSKVNSINYFTFWILDILCLISVNCFALITGYLMIKSKWKLKSFLNLWITVLFYSIIIGILGFTIVKNNFDLKLIVNSFLPLSRKNYWYFTSYAGLFFLMPFLNKMILNLSKKDMKTGIILIFIMGFISTVFKADTFNFDHGYSMIWLSFLYFIGAYINLHVDTNKIQTSSLFKKYSLVNFITIVIVIGTSLLTTRLFGSPKGVKWFLDYTSPFILLSSILFFLLFLKIEIKIFIFKNSNISFSVIF